MKLIAVYHKGEALKQISHLDVQRTLQRAFRRASLPLAYSNGFNPHPLVSFASATATGMASEAEWFQVQLAQDIAPQAFEARVNAALPTGFRVSGAMIEPDGFGTLAAKLRGAAYSVRLHFDAPIEKASLESALVTLLSGEIMIEKRTKSGMKTVDIRPYILEVSVGEVGNATAVLHVLGILQSDGGLRVDAFVDAFIAALGAHASFVVTRTNMYFADDGLLPRLPLE